MSRAREFADLAGSADAGGLTGKNMVTNGAMQVAQRGTSFSYAHDGTISGYTLDRYNFQFVSSENFDCTVAQVSDGPDGFSNSLKITTGTAESAVAADEYYALFQGIEAQNLQSLGYGASSAKTTTLSFYVKSSLTGTFGLSLYQADDARIISKTYTINSANTWERKTINIAGDTTGVIDNDNGGGIYIYWNLGTGSNYDSGTTATTWTSYTTTNFQDSSSSDAVVTTAGAAWQITGVQLEVGEQATPFEHRSYADEYQKCLRYYWRWTADTAYDVLGNGGYDVDTTCLTLHSLPVTMRTEPTISLTGSFQIRADATNFTPSSTQINRATPWNVELTHTVADNNLSGKTGRFRTDNDDDAFVEHTAEL